MNRSCKTTQRPFGGVVGETNPAVGREAIPALQYVVDRLGNRRTARQFGPLGSQPGLKFGGEKTAFLPASLQPFVGGKPVDPALDVKQRVDALDGLERDR